MPIYKPSLYSIVSGSPTAGGFAGYFSVGIRNITKNMMPIKIKKRPIGVVKNRQEVGQGLSGPNYIS
jgi:hypothetical protein